MNRINRLFQDKKSSILSIYFCAGSPVLDNTVEVLETLERNGVDLVEIGIPFSDPMADGVVIQAAADKALINGMSLRLLFNQLSDVRKSVKIPLILMGYLNPIMQFGFEDFCKKCVECGVDGAIIPDLPYAEYKESYESISNQYGIKIVMLITPETSEERIRLIDQSTESFIYMVSTASTTGAQNSFKNTTQDYFERVANMNLKNPRLVGFGISNKETYDAACQYSCGGIIGSRFVTLLSQTDSAQEAITQLKEQLGV